MKNLQSLLLIISLFNLFSWSCGEVDIDPAVMDAGQTCFRISTPNATYFYQKEAGGFSSILDKDGIDWIGFKPDPDENYPSSAASSYRGLPNMVFRSEDGGAGHPGFKQCKSEQISHNQIRTISKSGLWQWTWTFHPDHAILKIDKTDPSHPYWFLYEGAVAGRFQPDEQYWGTDKGGPNYSKPDYYAGNPVYDQWKWFYAGDKGTDRVLFIAQRYSDELSDTFSYLGNSDAGSHARDGMVVFGFGRTEDATALMNKEGQTFVIGFIEKQINSKEDHTMVSKIIRRYVDQ